MCGVFVSSAEHESEGEGIHFSCLISLGYPPKCTAACFPFELVNHLRRGNSCWNIAPPKGVEAPTGWIIDYDYITWKYSVVFDTGMVHAIPFAGGMSYSLLLACRAPQPDLLLPDAQI